VVEGAEYRVYRGGGWGAPARFARCSIRSTDAPGYRISFLGVRPAKSITSE